MGNFASSLFVPPLQNLPLHHDRLTHLFDRQSLFCPHRSPIASSSRHKYLQEHLPDTQSSSSAQPPPSATFDRQMKSLAHLPDTQSSSSPQLESFDNFGSHISLREQRPVLHSLSRVHTVPHVIAQLQPPDMQSSSSAQPPPSATFDRQLESFDNFGSHIRSVEHLPD